MERHRRGSGATVSSAVALVLSMATTVVQAGQAHVVDATVESSGDTYRFAVTVRHGDEGWDHYADRWEVLTPEGKVIGERTLHHPHENEQPFTRSLRGVEVPDGIARVRIRAHDSVHGYGGDEITLELP